MITFLDIMKTFRENNLLPYIKKVVKRHLLSVAVIGTGSDSAEYVVSNL